MFLKEIKIGDFVIIRRKIHFAGGEKCFLVKRQVTHTTKTTFTTSDGYKFSRVDGYVFKDTDLNVRCEGIGDFPDESNEMDLFVKRIETTRKINNVIGDIHISTDNAFTLKELKEILIDANSLVKKIQTIKK